MASLPLGWQSATIEELCSFSNGHGFRPNDWSSKGLPIIRIQNLNGSEQFNYFTGEPEDDWIVEPETILFAWAGTRGVSFGPTIWNGPRGVLNQHIFKVHPRRTGVRVWLVSILRVITERIERRSHGFKATLVHVRKEDITSQIIRYLLYLNSARSPKFSALGTRPSPLRCSSSPRCNGVRRG